MAKGVPYDRDKVLQSLKPFFLLGYTKRKACLLAKLEPSNLTRWEKDDPSIAIEIQAWQGSIGAKAREAVARSITGDPENGVAPNVEVSKWWLERMERDSFSTRVENDLTTNGENISFGYRELLEEKKLIKTDRESEEAEDVSTVSEADTD